MQGPGPRGPRPHGPGGFQGPRFGPRGMGGPPFRPRPGMMFAGPGVPGSVMLGHKMEPEVFQVIKHNSLMFLVIKSLKPLLFTEK